MVMCCGTWLLLCPVSVNCDQTNVQGHQLPKLGVPKSQIHKIENINVSLNFIASEGVKLVGIGAEGNIWLYSVSQ